MARRQLTTDEPIAPEQLKARVCRAADTVQWNWSEWTANDYVAGCPFGVTDEQLMSCNWDMPNSSLWADATLNGDELPTADSKMGQHFSDKDSVAEVVKTAAHIVDDILEAFPQVAAVQTQTMFVVAKVCEAFAYRIGIIEMVAADALERSGYEVSERTLEEIAADESDHIDIRTESGATFDVKFDSDNSTSSNRIDVTPNGDGTLDIEIEE